MRILNKWISKIVNTRVLTLNDKRDTQSTAKVLRDTLCIINF